MTTITLTPAQHAILAYAIAHSGGRINWFPEHIKGGARQRVLDSLFSRALITTDGTDWFVAAEGFEALGLPRPGAKTPVGSFEVHIESAPATASDTELEAAVTAAEAAWVLDTQRAAKSRRSRADSKQAQVIAMLRRPEGATIRQIMEATGWQAHTVRGTLAGALRKKLGLAIVSEKTTSGDRIYRIIEQDAA